MEFIIGLIGSFSGGSNATPLTERRFSEIDRDDFDAHLARLAPQVALDLPFCDALTIREWDDFHPDTLAERVPALSKLLAARDSVSSPETMRALVFESGIDAAIDAPVGRPQEPVATDVAVTSESDLLDSILSGAPSDSPVRVAPASADPQFEQMIAELVGDAAIRTDHAQEARFREAIDREIADRMRAILRAPAMQRLVATWGSLRQLVRKAQTGDSLRIKLIDVTREELRADIASSEKIGETLLFKRIVEEEKQTPGGQPFGLLLFDAELGAEREDLLLLAYLAALAGMAEAPLVASADSKLWTGSALEIESARAIAEKVGAFPGADRIGLTAARALARLPHGADGDPIDRFQFEENPEDAIEGYTWANAGWSLARIAVTAHAATGTVQGLERFTRLDGLPFYAFRRDGVVQSVGPTDRLFTENEIHQLNQSGLMALTGIRGTDEAFIASFKSLTGAPLFGG